MLEAARRGDEQAFEALVERHRGELHAHCYRMLGSVQDAEDALQDALVRAWRALGRFEGRSSLRSWLYRIATNTCLDVVSRRPRRVLPLDYGPAADPHDGPVRPLLESVWIDPYPDTVFGVTDGFASPDARFEQRESVELAFVAALQHLPPRQRAVLVLREVLGFSAKEVAKLLETTTASVNSALQRARATLDEKLPDRSQQETARQVGDERLRETVATYVDAWERGDVAAVVALLAQDATITMPPMPTWYAGRAACEVFLSKWAFARRWDSERFVEGERDVRLVVTSAGGQPAIGAYRWDAERGAFVPYALQVLSFDTDGLIAEVDGFVAPELFAHFGLAAELAR